MMQRSIRQSGQGVRHVRRARFTLAAFAVIAAVAPVATFAQTGTLRDGSLVAWGSNDAGQYAVPSGTFRAVSGGFGFGIALRTDGTLVGWGASSIGQINVPSGTFTAIASGADFTVALRPSGTMAYWGTSFSNGMAENIPLQSGVNAIGTGYYNAFFTRGASNNQASGFGYSVYGLNSVPQGTYRMMAGSESNAVGLLDDGSLVTWGVSPSPIISGKPTTGQFVSVAISQTAAFAIDAGGFIHAWGDNSAGCLNAPTDGGFVEMAIGGATDYGMALRGDGSIAAWGINHRGELNTPSGIFTALACGGQTAGYGLRGATSYAGDLRIYGTGPTANLNRSVAVTGNATIESSPRVFNNATLSVGGTLTVQAGVVLDSTGFFSATGTLKLFRADQIQSTVTTYSPISAGSLTGNASLYVITPVSVSIGLSNVSSYNGGITLAAGSTFQLTGTGQQTAAFLTNNGGTVRVPSGGALITPSFYEAGIINSGQVLLGTAGATSSVELSSQTAILNEVNGVISARNALISSGQGLTNSGGIAFTGGSSDILGKVTNLATGTLTITAGASVVFSDDVVQNGTLVIRKLGTVTSSAVFLGSFSGSGGFTGGGTAYIEGDLAPGNSPAAVAYGGDVALGPTSRTIIELAGTTPGLEYDRLVVAGELSLGGTLDLRFLGGFTGTPYPYTYDVISAGSLTGDFDHVLFPDATGGWLLYRTPTTLSVGRFTVVPEPSAVALLAAAVPVAVRRRRR